jgi:hypothetical protein
MLRLVPRLPPFLSLSLSLSRNTFCVAFPLFFSFCLFFLLVCFVFMYFPSFCLAVHLLLLALYFACCMLAAASPRRRCSLKGRNLKSAEKARFFLPRPPPLLSHHSPAGPPYTTAHESNPASASHSQLPQVRAAPPCMPAPRVRCSCCAPACRTRRADSNPRRTPSRRLIAKSQFSLKASARVMLGCD